MFNGSMQRAAVHRAALHCFTILVNELKIDHSFASVDDGTTLKKDNNLINNNADKATYVPPTGDIPLHGIIYMTTYGTGNTSATASFKANDLLI